jgi:hypothetical protein
MDATPSAVARTITRRPAPAPPSDARPSSAPDRRRGDLVTVDPEDRRRRARAALLDLAIEQAMRRAH